MNKALRHFLTGFLCTTAFLHADIDYQSVGSENMIPYGAKKGTEAGPFNVEANYDWIGQSAFEGRHLRGQHIKFNEGQVETGFTFYYEPEYEEGARFDLNYTFTDLDWKDNPNFDQKHFNTIGFNLGFASKRMCNWLWRLGARLNIDADHFNFNEYSDWDLLFWGRYNYSDDIRVHVGFVAMTGMKIDRIYPILGFDWDFYEDWKLNLVFPMNISLKYSISSCWTAGIAARFFDSRHRTGKHEPLPQSLWEYRNSGIELATDYMWAPYVHLNVHGGTTFGGILRTANRHYKHIHRHRFKPAGYFGGDLTINF